MKYDGLPAIGLCNASTDADGLPPVAEFRNAPTIQFAEHLFISGDTNFINEQHIGRVAFPAHVKTGWHQIMQERQSRFASHGASFLFLLAPDKQTVYRHILPKTYCYRQAAFLGANDFTIDPSAALCAAAQIADVYPRNDSHWNHFGALIVVNMIMARYGVGIPDLKPRWVESDRLGDLGLKLSPQETAPKLFAMLKSAVGLVYDNCVPNNGRVRVWSKPATSIVGAPTKLMIVGDSFAYDLVHFLKEICNCPGCRLGSSCLKRLEEGIWVLVQGGDHVPALLFCG